MKIMPITIMCRMSHNIKMCRITFIGDRKRDTKRGNQAGIKRFAMRLKHADRIQNDLNHISLERSSPFSELSVGWLPI